MSRFIQLIKLILLKLEIFCRLDTFLVLNNGFLIDFLAWDITQSFSGDGTHASVRCKIRSNSSGLGTFDLLWRIWWIWVLADGPRLVLIIWIFHIVQINCWLNDIWLFILNTSYWLDSPRCRCRCILSGSLDSESLLIKSRFVINVVRR